MKIKLQLLDEQNNVLISSTINQKTVETVKELHNVNVLDYIYNSLKEDLKNNKMKIEKIEINPNQFVWVDKGTQIKDVRPFKGKWHLEKGLIINKFPDYLTDLSDCKLIIAASPELNLDGLPTNL
jgi:adenylate cyclase